MVVPIGSERLSTTFVIGIAEGVGELGKLSALCTKCMGYNSVCAK